MSGSHNHDHSHVEVTAKKCQEINHRTCPERLPS